MSVNRTSDTWKAVADWIAHEHTSALMLLSKSGTTLADTEFQRGVIATLERLEALAKPAATIETITPVPYA